MAIVACQKFTGAYPRFYSAIVAFKLKGIPKGYTPTKLVRSLLGQKCSGAWTTKEGKQNGVSGVFILFADFSDFDAVKLHLGGKAWRSIFPASIDSFSATFP